MAKFNEKWASQTDIGKLFGLSAVALGKELDALGLRDPSSKVPTKTALKEGWCISTPLKNEQAYWMWSRIKLSDALASKGFVKIGAAQKAANELMFQLKKAQKYIDEGSKLGYIMQDAAYDEVPKNLRDEVDVILKAKGIG